MCAWVRGCVVVLCGSISTYLLLTISTLLNPPLISIYTAVEGLLEVVKKNSDTIRVLELRACVCGGKGGERGGGETSHADAPKEAFLAPKEAFLASGTFVHM